MVSPDSQNGGKHSEGASRFVDCTSASEFGSDISLTVSRPEGEEDEVDEAHQELRGLAVHGAEHATRIRRLGCICMYV